MTTHAHPFAGKHVMLVALEGFMDDGYCASDTVEYLLDRVETERMHRLVGPEFYADGRLLPMLTRVHQGRRQIDHPSAAIFVGAEEGNEPPFLGEEAISMGGAPWDEAYEAETFFTADNLLETADEPELRFDHSFFTGETSPWINWLARQLFDIRVKEPVLPAEGAKLPRLSFFLGPDPHLSWARAVEMISDICYHEEVDAVIFVRAAHSPVPHTREPLVQLDSYSPEIQDLLGIDEDSYTGPLPFSKMLEFRLTENAIPTMSATLAVPMYLRSFPAGTMALLAQLEQLLGIRVNTEQLEVGKLSWELTFAEQVQGNEELARQVELLEAGYEERAAFATSGRVATDIEAYLQYREEHMRETGYYPDEDGEEWAADEAGSGFGEGPGFEAGTADEAGPSADPSSGDGDAPGTGDSAPEDPRA